MRQATIAVINNNGFWRYNKYSFLFMSLTMSGWTKEKLEKKLVKTESPKIYREKNYLQLLTITYYGV